MQVLLELSPYHDGSHSPSENHKQVKSVKERALSSFHFSSRSCFLSGHFKIEEQCSFAELSSEEGCEANLNQKAINTIIPE